MENNNGFFEGFAWAVPSHFKDALANCFFDRGDVLYDERKAYELPWGDVKNTIRMIKVMKVSGSQTTEFDINWDAEIEIEFSGSVGNAPIRINTTQGRLYSTLWTGKMTFFTDGIYSFMPFMLKDAMLKKALDATVKYITPYFTDNYDYIFFFPFDLTNSISTEKIRKVSAHFHVQQEKIKHNYKEVTPKELGLPPHEKYAPTMKYAVFSVSGELDFIKKCLKNALYMPPKMKICKQCKKDVNFVAEKCPYCGFQFDMQDKFNLERHGRLIKNPVSVQPLSLFGDNI